jgi:DNA-binding response OmpR family regulator
MAGYHHPDALILAEELTEVATATVVSIARTHFDCPIVIGTGDASVESVGASLLAGASHVVRRPYDAQEVVLTLRRLSPTMIDGRLEDGCLRLGRLELSTVAYRVTLDSRELALPLKAFQLLRLLMLHSDRVVSRDEIRHELWGDDALAPDSNAIAVRIRDIREALRDPGLVRTVRGLGYRLDTASLNG